MPKIKAFFKKYERKIVLALGLLLIAGLSFQMGYLKGQKLTQNPLIIEVPGNCPNFENKTSETQNKSLEAKSPTLSGAPADQSCAFVGSKNSTKYHLPDCSGAKRIKSENLVCFKSAEDAVSQGYEPSKDCLK